MTASGQAPKTAMVLAAAQPDAFLNEVQAALSGSTLRVYTSDDLAGVTNTSGTRGAPQFYSDMSPFERTMQDGARSVRSLCEIAADRGLQVDLHCDESDDPMSRHVETLERFFYQ